MSLCGVCKNLMPAFIAPHGGPDWKIFRGPGEWISYRRYHDDSLESFYASLEASCPVCFCVWRHIRSSPYDKPSKPALDDFNSWPDIVLYYPKEERYRVILRVTSKRFLESETKQSIVLSVWKTSHREYLQETTEDPIDGNPLSEPAICRVQNWLHDCSTTHSRCQERKKKLDDLVGGAVLPRRLLNLGVSSSKTWSIVETDQDAKYSEYIALSHRWTPSTPVLLRHNIVDFKQDDNTKTLEKSTGSPRDACSVATSQCVYPDGALPKDYQTVIQLCRKLSVQYLWVDSLCIIQGPDGDFSQEAPKMMDVYRKAFLTLSICWALPEDPTSDQRITPIIARLLPGRESMGLLLSIINRLLMVVARILLGIGALVLFIVLLPLPFPTWLLGICYVLVQLVPWQFPLRLWGLYPNSDLTHAFVEHEEEFSKCVSEAAINQRGWVFQERALSQRILYLGNEQLYWECDHLTASEDDPEAYTRYGCRESIHTRNQETVKVPAFSLTGLHVLSWPRMMKNYSSKALTYEKDRLVAIAGLARLRSLLTQEQYIAGIWINYWHFDLMWFPVHPRSVRPWPSYRCVHTPPGLPSWSWASFPSAIEWYDVDRRAMFDTSKIDSFELGPVKSLAHLRGTSVSQEFINFDGASLDIGCLRIPARLGSEISARTILSFWGKVWMGPAMVRYGLDCMNKRYGQVQNLCQLQMLPFTSVEDTIPLRRVTSYHCITMSRK
ncbi:hypothetical protein CDV36_013375 [Fusarium kuroshium]|uniref:Heterokaryon incompatibility domain-containing protein n=1 Tax=Fusarium kuroshium TaxID=2010991 RepID=A0A3M2RP45_9HYPO|nr:hypothetical protein CDV36_013375 [Fusarium kuroshium]